LTATQLLTELTRRGFRLDVDDDAIGVEPASKLTEALRQAIRNNKGELLALVLARRAPKHTRKHRARRQLVTSPSTLVADSTNPVTSGESNTDTAFESPELCPRCRGFGYPICRECALASEPGLVLGQDGVIYRVKPPPQPVVRGWHRCEECYEPYQGVLPPFGTAKRCPKCIRSL